MSDPGLALVPSLFPGRERWQFRAGTGTCGGLLPQRAFTLMELLVVMAIVGLLTAVSLPAIRGLAKSNVMAAANRQLLDDLALARQYAISIRAPVYVIFAPPVDVQEQNLYAPLDPVQREKVLLGQQTSYAIYSLRNVGDQPGDYRGRYLAPWRSLPDGVFIPASKFTITVNGITPFAIKTTGIVVPTQDGVENPKKYYVAFDAQGRSLSKRDEIIPLARGGIFYARDAAGGLAWAPADAFERPPNNSIDNYNHIVIDGLTGRAKVMRPEIQ